MNGLKAEIGQRQDLSAGKGRKDLQVEIAGRIERRPAGTNNMAGMDDGCRKSAQPCLLQQIGFDRRLLRAVLAEGKFRRLFQCRHGCRLAVRPDRAGMQEMTDMAVSRFNAFNRLRRELADARSALEERKLVERAKGILMKMRGLSEEEAFALLRQTAMNEKKKMSEIAQSVVTAAGLLM